MPQQRILVPIEASIASRRAIAAALNFANSGRWEVFLFKIGSPKEFGRLGGEELKTAVDRQVETMRKLLTSVIVSQSKRRELDLERIGKIHHRFSVGGLETEILKMAGAISADLILMGCSTPEDADHGDADYELTPDVAAGIVKRAPCSVFSIRPVDETFVIL